MLYALGEGVEAPAASRAVRDLHHGTQQHLVNTVITLKLALRALEDGQEEASALVACALEQAERATAELREVRREMRR